MGDSRGGQHLDVNPADLLTVADTYAELAARVGQISPAAAQEAQRIAATHGPIGYPAAAGIAAGLAAREPDIAAKTADFVTYSQRFTEAPGVYVSEDEEGAARITAVDFKTEPPPKIPGDDKGDDKDDKDGKHGGEYSKGKGAKGHVTVTGDPEKTWGTPTDPHEIWPNNPGRNGTFDGDHGNASWKGPGAQGEAYAGQYPDGYTGKADAGAWLAKGEASWQRDVFGNPLTATADGGIGAHTNAEATVTDHGISAGVDGFVGAEINGNVGYDFGPVDASLGGGLKYGAGGNADLDFGMQDGKFVIGATLGAAWGPGAEIAPHIAIDPKFIEDNVTKATDWLSGLFN